MPCIRSFFCAHRVFGRHPTVAMEGVPVPRRQQKPGRQVLGEEGCGECGDERSGTSTDVVGQESTRSTQERQDAASVFYPTPALASENNDGTYLNGFARGSEAAAAAAAAAVALAIAPVLSRNFPPLSLSAILSFFVYSLFFYVLVGDGCLCHRRAPRCRSRRVVVAAAARCLTWIDPGDHHLRHPSQRLCGERGAEGVRGGRKRGRSRRRKAQAPARRHVPRLEPHRAGRGSHHQEQQDHEAQGVLLLLLLLLLRVLLLLYSRCCSCCYYCCYCCWRYRRAGRKAQ